MSQPSSHPPVSAYERVGGDPVVRSMVDRFYDLMEADPDYGDLRALHAADLGPMRESLTGFLIAWLGGPRDWFDAHPGKCMMSAHRDIAMTQRTARQWADAMVRAVSDCVPEKDIAVRMAGALSDMAVSMAAR